MFKMNTLAVGETGVLHVKGPKGELLYDGAGTSKPCEIEVWSPGSSAFAEALAWRDAQMVEWVRENGAKDQPFDKKWADTATFLAKITKGFNNWTYDADGPASGEALFRAAYFDRSIGFITAQLERFIGDWGNFTKGSATS